MLDELVANKKFLQPVLNNNKNRTVPVFAWLCTVTSLAWQCVQPEIHFFQPGEQFSSLKLKGNVQLGKYGS